MSLERAVFQLMANSEKLYFPIFFGRKKSKQNRKALHRTKRTEYQPHGITDVRQIKLCT